MKKPIILLISLLLAATLRAATVTSATGDGSATVTATYNETTNEIEWTRTLISGGATSHYQGQAWLYRVASNGSTTSLGAAFDLGAGTTAGTYSASGQFTAVADSWYLIAARVLLNGPNTVAAGPEYAWLQASPPEPEYYADFKVPKNLGADPVTIQVWQNGALKTSTSVGPGSGESEMHVTGLDAEGTVFVNYVYKTYQRNASGVIEEGQGVTLGAGSAEPTDAAEPPEPTQLASFLITPKKTVPNKPDPLPTPSPTPSPIPTPSPVATPTLPSATAKPTRGAAGIPFGSPSGSSATTKADTETATNALAATIDNADANRQASDDKALDALDTVASTVAGSGVANVSALNALRDESATGTNKQLEATGQLNTTLTNLRDDVRAGNATLQDIADSLALQDPVIDPNETSATLTAIAALATDLGNSVTEATNVQPNKGSVDTDDTNKGSGIKSITLPGGSDVEISLNPLNNEKVQQLAGLLRALIGWSVIFLLVAWTYIQIPIWMTEALKGGTGFTAWRAVTGALPLVGVAVMTAMVILVSALMLTFPTILWAYADPLLMGTADSALVDVRSIMTSYGGPDAGEMISLLDAVCPTGLVMVATFNYITLRVGGQAICAGFIALSKPFNS